MASDPAGNGAGGNGKAELDELIRSKEEELKALHEARRRWEEGPRRRRWRSPASAREEFETLSGLPDPHLHARARP